MRISLATIWRRRRSECVPEDAPHQHAARCPILYAVVRSPQIAPPAIHSARQRLATSQIRRDQGHVAGCVTIVAPRRVTEGAPLDGYRAHLRTVGALGRSSRCHPAVDRYGACQSCDARPPRCCSRWRASASAGRHCATSGPCKRPQLEHHTSSGSRFDTHGRNADEHSRIDQRHDRTEPPGSHLYAPYITPIGLPLYNARRAPRGLARGK